MLFNSFEFLLFLPVVFLLYWFVFQKNLKAQNAFVLVASYVFYGWWDWRFLILILGSSLVDYFCGLELSSSKTILKKRLILALSIGVNLGVLGFFKYYNFFLDSFIRLFNLIGFQSNYSSLQLILPVGISFYTLQTLSYTLDIYSGKIKPTKDLVAFLGFVSFFPQLVAGPIERAKDLLPQFLKSRVFNYADFIIGLRFILWGFFKKMVIADNCAPIVDWIFLNHENLHSAQLILGLVLFSFQIYCDFSGYSDIAIGVARTFGFKLQTNFRVPFFSKNLMELWRNWHISLYSWFRDYVYYGFGGNTRGKVIQIRNIFLVFMLSALWHGAEFSFLFWGFLNFLFILPMVLKKMYFNQEPTPMIGNSSRILKILFTFLLFTAAAVYFRAPNFDFANKYLWHLIKNFDLPIFWTSRQIYMVIVLIVLFVMIEWIGKRFENTLDGILGKVSKFGRWGIYYSLVWTIIILGGRQQEFYYFQF